MLETSAKALKQRIAWLKQMRRDTLQVAEEWVGVSCKAKKIAIDGKQAAEEWLAGPMSVMRHMRLLQETLEHLLRTGEPQFYEREIQTRGGGVVAQVFPQRLADKVLLFGFSAEIRFLERPSVDEIRKQMARVYLAESEAKQKTCVVLGAGNVSSIGLQDVLNKVFSENQSCVLKMNPVNEYLSEVYLKSFSALVEEGMFQVVCGGAGVGEEWVQRVDVDAVHMTGSTSVHDAIVWGVDDEAVRNREAGTPKLDKPITSELGCVTPIVVVPGEWSRQDLKHHAWNIASMLVNNGSFNCNAAKVIVTSAYWNQRDEFLAYLREILHQIAPRYAYYPGAKERHHEFCEAYPEAFVSGVAEEGALPWVLATGLDASVTNELAFSKEAWCGVLAETALPESCPGEFLHAAKEFCNHKLFGTLSCGLIIHPKERKAYGDAYETVLSELHYGTVAVNAWPALVYALGVTPWGAHPGHTLEDVGSGIGFVHNTRMFENIEKCVLEAPFRGWIRPPWFANHRQPLRLAKALTRYEAQSSFGGLGRVMLWGIF